MSGPSGNEVPTLHLGEERPGVCSKCHANVTFVLDPYEQEWVSLCCWRPMETNDREPDA